MTHPSVAFSTIPASELDADVIVIGSGATGGWAAKEFCEKGLKTLVIEGGRPVKHRVDYPYEGIPPWQYPNRGRVSREDLAKQAVQQRNYAYDQGTKDFYVSDEVFPYQIEDGTEFSWIRGDQTGGKSLLWHRASWRMSDLDFNANKTDGHGNDWPLRYQDLAPWYDHVETFIGVSGNQDNIDVLPDGVFQPAFAMNRVEKVMRDRMTKAYSDRQLIMSRMAHLTKPTAEQLALGRSNCMARNECQKGCSFGAYFSSQSATLPAARRTNNLTLINNKLVTTIDYDAKRGFASAVNVIDRDTREQTRYRAKIIFLCASTLNSTQVLLNSKSEAFPSGLANRSDALGRYLMGHTRTHIDARIPGFDDEYYYGRRPGGLFVPRFVNVQGTTDDFYRGYSYYAQAARDTWGAKAQNLQGLGADLKNKLRSPGDWKFVLQAIGEMLPHKDNRVTLHPTKKDAYGIPQLLVDCKLRENDIKLRAHAEATSIEIMKALGCEDIGSAWVGNSDSAKKIFHEVGTCRMGHDPSESVVNTYNQCHDVPNLFVTDGSAWCSSGWSNPTLTFMAITARAADYAAKWLAAKA